MPTGGKIYTKTVDLPNQNNVDKNLIIDSRYAYQLKFPFGDDWDDIKLGLFVSFTGSLVDDNQDLPDERITHGETTFDQYTYIGLNRSSNPDYIPLDSNSVSFAGWAYNQLENVNNNNGSHYLTQIVGSNLVESFFSSKNDTVIDSTNLFPTLTVGRQSSSQTDFATYWGFRIKVLDRGLATQRLTFVHYTTLDHDASSSTFWNKLTDVSLDNLKFLLNGGDVASGSGTVRSLDMHDVGTPLSIPDSFLFYNGFLTIRPRIHAIAVKKFS